jgi:EAL domain-containing protein (putative c-di-GMP-specific phosphodiesterase class I)
MRELDQWVLRTATKEAASWPTHTRRPVGVAVNLAGLLPSDPDFLPTVRAALADSGLAGDRLVLELVETSLVSLPQRTLAAMSELAARGVRFAVDDFGTGYSSLSRVKELPAQIVKVDRTFVADISSDPADFAVARAVVQMASAMGRYTVAEGVETAEQFHILRDLGIDAYQGWLFAKALDAQAFRTLLSGPPLAVPAGDPPPTPDGLATQALPTGASLGAASVDRADPDSAGVAARSAEPPRAIRAVPSGLGPSAAPAPPAESGGAGDASAATAGEIPEGSGRFGSASASPGPLGGFHAAPDVFAAPIADLLAGALSARDTDEHGPTERRRRAHRGDKPSRHARPDDPAH